MMSKYVIALSLLFAFLGCSEQEEVNVIVEERASDVEKTVAKINVNGMMCEIACGGKIRKELSELEGVASTSVQFNGGENDNYALVEFNPDIISEKLLIETINKISDGRLYSVKDVLITHYVPSKDLTQASGRDGVNMKSPSFVIPGLIDVIWNLVGGFQR